jgi:hypothetical protein
MNMKNAEIVIEGGGIREITDILYKIEDEAQLGQPIIYSANDIDIIMKEEFYKRIGSTLMSVTILKFVSNNRVEIELVTGGGKNEVFISWGAEDSENRRRVHELMEVCKEKSWSMVSIEPEKLKQSAIESGVNELKEKFNKLMK